MHSTEGINKRLIDLKTRLEQVNHSWTVKDYESLMKFYIAIVPKIMDTELCSIFIVEPETDRIWLKYSTDLKEKEIMPSKDGTVVGSAISTGKWIIENDLAKSTYHKELGSKTKFITRNLICAPIKRLTDQGVAGAIEVLNKRGDGHFTAEDGELLQKIADYLSMALENILLNQEILDISSKLNAEIDQIWKEDIEFVSESRVMQNILNTVRVISSSPVDVLIQGESGTGKEVIARMIQKSSDRKDKPFVPVNCAAVPENLIESEFFGYERGAFTGAVSSRRGLFEEADGGTLFLDEIGDMPVVMQPKLLRVLQEGEGSRLGSNKSVSYDLRLISATNRDLRREVAEGRFREDLFYRIFSVEIYVPPLRERREDISPLAAFFLNNIMKKFRKKVTGLTPEVVNFFEEYPWPGNVRQLQHEVERLVALTPEGDRVSLVHCSPELQKWKNSRSLIEFTEKPDLSLHEKVRELEIACIRNALKESGGKKVEASKLLGITRQGMDKKMKRYNIGNDV